MTVAVLLPLMLEMSGGNYLNRLPQREARVIRPAMDVRMSLYQDSTMGWLGNCWRPRFWVKFPAKYGYSISIVPVETSM